MQESGIPGVIAILDTSPELNVVRDAIKDPSNKEDAEQDAIFRFEKQTRTEPSSEYDGWKPILIGGEIWEMSPQFRVLDSDRGFVLQAAQRILEQGNIFSKLKNIATKRQQAARDIVSFFDES